MRKQLKFLSYLGAAAGLFIFSACSDDDDNGSTAGPVGPTQNIVEIAADNPEYSILAEALTATGLDATLAGEGPFTVFAPDNDAFEALFDAVEVENATELINTLGEDGVRDVLLYHVLGAQINAAEVPEDAYVTTASTASPDNNQLSLRVQSAGGVVLNASTNVVAADIQATNGVIHGIDAVLMPPTIVDHAANNALFGELVNALGATALDNTLAGAGPFTVMAPVNAAFQAISSTVEGLTTQELSDILLYHVVAGNVRSEDLDEGPVGTLNPGQAEFTVSFGPDDTVIISDNTGGEATVLLTDVQGTNGVIHVIDTVLLP